jgi:uncharacterized SAM-binding protein YcdF (DUF218 family)
LAFFTFPSNLTILIGILGLLMLTTRFARTGRRLAFVSLAVLALLGLSPVGNAFMLPLENRFPAWDVSHGVPDGIIVLGGAVDASGPDEQAVLNEAAERLVVVPELARRYPNARILFSGGNSALMDGGSAEAEFAAHLLEGLSGRTLSGRSAHTCRRGCAVAICDHERRAAADRHCRPRMDRTPRILAHRAHLRVVSGANSRRPSKGVAALNDGQ